MKILIFFLLFFLLCAFFIISNENLALNKADKRLDFARHYYQWFVSLAGNFKAITGAVIDAKWFPDSGKVIKAK